MPAVLVVDDTPTVRAALERILRRAGYETVSASDGAVALRIARSQELTAALVDYQMPGMDGLTVLTELRRIQPNTVRLLVSGALDLDVVIHAVNRGEVSRVIAKPVRAAELVEAVANSISTREVLGQGWVASQDESRTRKHEALRGLLGGDRVKLGLQPVVSAAGMQVVAFEGLMRVSDEVLPGVEQVLAAAETAGAIPELGAIVARRAADWLGVLPSATQLYMNLHPVELESPSILMSSMEPLLPLASRVVLEITERCPLPPGGSWIDSIAAVREAGFRIAVDDLGSGASSLAALAEIDPDVLKLDMSLIRGLDGEVRKKRLVEMLCRFAAASGIEVVAEGIETEAEARAATALGVDLLQGYWLGRPALEPERILAYADAASLPHAGAGASGAHPVIDLAEHRTKKSG